MKTKPTMKALIAMGITILVSIMSVNVMAERKGMMSDEEMEKVMRDRSRDCEDMHMMGRGLGMGSGMMGSGMMGSGMMGSGMMGSGMMGSGMMGSGMMGSGMMGSSTMGSGMMGSGMMGGMGMSGRMAEMLDITDKQRATMRKIARDLRRSNIQRMSKIMDARDQFDELYEKETLDAKAIGAVYGQIFDLRQQMFEAGIEAKNKRRNVLSKEQKERFEHMGGMMSGR